MNQPATFSLPRSFILVAILSILAFHKSYDGDFVFDDLEAIVNNKDVRNNTMDMQSFYELFSHDFWGTRLSSNSSHKSYRPLTVLTFRLNYILAAGLDSRHFHIVNIVLHCAVCLTFVIFVSIILSDGQSFSSASPFLYCYPEVSTLAALLFAVLPVHSESVAGIVGRADLLCALNFMFSFIFYVKAVYTEKLHGKLLYYLITSVLVLTSVLFKEPGLTVLGVCSAYDILIVSKLDPQRLITAIRKPMMMKIDYAMIKVDCLLRHVFLIALGISIFAVRWNLMGSTAPTFQPVDNPHSFVDNTFFKVLNFNYIYAINAWLLINPKWLCFDWSMGCVPIISSTADYRLFCVVFFWILFSTLLIGALFYLRTSDQRRVLLAVSLIVIPFIPASNLLFRVGFVVAERNLYLPSTGLVILVAMGASTLYTRFPVSTAAMFTLLLATNLYRCIQRSSDWVSEQRLYETALTVCPLNAKVHYNVAKVYSDKGRVDFAMKEYKEAIRLHPHYDQAMNNLGNLYRDAGNLDEAEKLLQQAVHTRSDFAVAWMNLGIVQAALKKFAQAEASYRTALFHRRRYPDCYYNLGNLYLDANKNEDALQAWSYATQIQPTHLNAWTNSIILLDNLGRREELNAVAAKALRHNPTESAIHFHYASSMGKIGKFETSEKHFLMALEHAKVTDNIASYHANLGVLYHRWGKLDDAERHYGTAADLDPTNKQTQDNYKLLQRLMESRRHS